MMIKLHSSTGSVTYDIHIGTKSALYHKRAKSFLQQFRHLSGNILQKFTCPLFTTVELKLLINTKYRDTVTWDIDLEKQKHIINILMT